MSRERCPTCKRAMPKPLPRKRAKPRRVAVNRDPKYRRWCRERLCAISSYGSLMASIANHDDAICSGGPPNDAAHTARTNGMSSKGPDSSCVPLCRKHHREYDAGRAAFEAKYGISLQAKAKEYFAQFLKETEK